MPVYFHRLENALKRANEFIDVDKKPSALDILGDVLRSRKHRTWQKKHEDIMIKYLELCVELRQSYVAKEGIYQYKIICQQAYINSFQDVVRKYLTMANEKANLAREESQAAVLDVDDLDNMQTPENILLSAVSSEDTQDRTDRVVLLPWVRFLWESYRQCLDLLRNNARTEKLYHEIAHQAFDFCIKYNRKTEFRKLCDNLHNHLDALKKQQLQPPTSHQLQNMVNLTNPETQNMHLETRLVQLDCAIKMELWQEAYKATDDIKKFGLMNLSKKPLKPQLMATYYQKLALVFQKANCPLFHAAALFRLFNLTKELRKNITQEDIQKMASKVVAATLAIPIAPTRPEIDKLVDTEENVLENHQRNLASLLGLSTAVPTRKSLIVDLRRMGVLQCAYGPMQELYKVLELEFYPLTLCKRVNEVVSFMNECETCSELKNYVVQIKDVTIIRLLKEISQVYQSIDYKRLKELCPFADSIYLEIMVVNAARRNDLQVRIDHRKGCLYFGTGLNVSQGEEKVEGPNLQSMPSEQIRQQLVTMYSVLQRAKVMIDPGKYKNYRDEMKRQVMLNYERKKLEDHKNILERQNFIERRKEELEQLGIEREKEERKIMEEKQQKLKEAEEERMLREAEERARQRKEIEDRELKKRMAKDQIEKMKQTDAGMRLIDGVGEDELIKLKPDEIKHRQWEQLEKERKDQIAKQRKVERKFDHMERAKRAEEIPLLLQAYEEWKVEDRKSWDENELNKIKNAKLERDQALQHRERLLRMMTDKDTYANQITGKRHADFVEKFEEWKEIMESTKEKRLAERKVQRKEERRLKWIQKQKEEEAEKKREAEKKAEREKEAKLEEQRKKQLQRDNEVEEKYRKKDEELMEKQKKKEKQDAPLSTGPNESWRKGPSEKPESRNIPWRSRRAMAEEERDRDRDFGHRDRGFNRDTRKGPGMGRRDDYEPSKRDDYGPPKDQEQEKNWRGGGRQLPNQRDRDDIYRGRLSDERRAGRDDRDRGGDRYRSRPIDSRRDDRYGGRPSYDRERRDDRDGGRPSDDRRDDTYGGRGSDDRNRRNESNMEGSCRSRKTVNRQDVKEGEDEQGWTTVKTRR